MPEGGGSETAEQRVIGFSVNLAESVKAASRITRAPGDGEFGLDNTQLKEQGFGVYCWYTHYDFDNWDRFSHISGYLFSDGFMPMRNQKVEWTGTQWDYSPTKYWPLQPTDKLMFRAYAPYVTYSLKTNAHGMPMLPVVVSATDYHNGTQHDPLWGTGKLVNPSTREYYDGDETTYGQHYDNITFEMSGDYRQTNADETHNGVINWYFHHGMSKITFTCSVTKDPGCDKVTIMGIRIGKLYDQGLLDISSPAASSADKPDWDDCQGNIDVELGASDLASSLDIETSKDAATSPVDVLGSGKGLLVIPRDFSTDGLTVTLLYTVDDEKDLSEATVEIHPTFYGNTTYQLNMSLTPMTKGVEIDIVQSGFTAWKDGGSGDRPVHNW